MQVTAAVLVMIGEATISLCTAGTQLCVGQRGVHCVKRASKHKVFSDPYFLVFSSNTGK